MAKIEKSHCDKMRQNLRNLLHLTVGNCFIAVIVEGEIEETSELSLKFPTFGTQKSHRAFIGKQKNRKKECIFINERSQNVKKEKDRSTRNGAKSALNGSFHLCTALTMSNLRFLYLAAKPTDF